MNFMEALTKANALIDAILLLVRMTQANTEAVEKNSLLMAQIAEQKKEA